MELLSTKKVYKKGGITLTEKVFKAGNKKVTRVSLSLGKNAVLIIPVDKDGNFYMGHQKRENSKDFIIEFPNGGIEKGEKELDAAKRELSEELGLEGNMKYLGKFRPFTGLVDLEVTVFLCENAKEQNELKKLKPDFYEKIERKKHTEKEIYSLIKEGKISQSYLLSALSLFKASKSK
jgi:ADP-ribose pyrophosphatase